MSKEYWMLKAKFLMMYGYFCACCGEPNPKFLTLDHVNQDGVRAREQIGFHTVKRDGKESPPIPHIIYPRPYQALRDAIQEYRPDRFQILCYNCNCARAHNDGVCPHKDEKRDMKRLRREQWERLSEG